MSDGKTHQRITTLLIAPTAVSALFLTGDIATAVSAGAGCAFNIVCGPDLDQPGITRNETVLLHSRIGCLGVPWVMFWYPYAFAIPHRHWLSHAPVISTLIRDLYLSIPLILIALIFDAQTAVFQFVMNYAYLFIAFVVGQIIADTAHYCADVIHTKKVKHGRKHA